MVEPAPDGSGPCLIRSEMRVNQRRQTLAKTRATKRKWVRRVRGSPHGHCFGYAHWGPMLHKTSYMRGFQILATDGEVGHVDDFLVDESRTRRCSQFRVARRAGSVAA